MVSENRSCTEYSILIGSFYSNRPVAGAPYKRVFKNVCN